VAIIAGVTSGINAKRTALIHLLFNCSGVIVFMLAGWLMTVLSNGNLSYGTMFNSMFPGAPQTQLAMFHTFFNVITVAFMLPLTGLLVNAVTKIIPEKNNGVVETLKLRFVDNNMLQAPPIAVVQTKKEILRMANLALENFDRSLRIITTGDFSERETFDRTEEEINFINRTLVDFVVKLTDKKGLNEHDHIYLSTTFRTVRDIERIGDYADNIVEYADALKAGGDKFSDDALYEISQLKILVHSLFDKSIAAYSNESLADLEEANVIEEEIDDFTKRMEDNHIERLSKGVCNSNTGTQYLELSSDTERIADHLINVAKTIRSLV